MAGSGTCVIKEFVHLDLATQDAFRASVRALVPTDATSIPYPGGGNLGDALRIGLCGELFSDRWNPPVIALSYEDSVTALESIMSGEALGSAQDSPEVRLLRAVRKMQDCRLFLSYEGHVGWAPKTARTGDQIATLLGCSAPIVLRKASPTDHNGMAREVVGPCYLQGFMHGETLIGSLPDGIRCIWQPSDGFELQYLDLLTGVCVDRDPRLASLPIDPLMLEAWEKRTGGTIHIENEVWQSRGISIDYFYLICSLKHKRIGRGSAHYRQLVFLFSPHPQKNILSWKLYCTHSPTQLYKPNR